MPSKLPVITLRLDEETNKKIKEIAKLNCRKINDEIKYLILQHIKEYEKENGELKIDKKNTINNITNNTLHNGNINIKN